MRPGTIGEAIFPARMAVEPLWRFVRYPVAMLLAAAIATYFVGYLLLRVHIVMSWPWFVGVLLLATPAVAVFCVGLRQTRLVVTPDGITAHTALHSARTTWSGVTFDSVGSKVFLKMSPVAVQPTGLARLFSRGASVDHFTVIPSNFVQQYQGRDLTVELRRHAGASMPPMS